MAVGALGGDRGRSGCPDIDNCPIRETCLDRRQMVPTRSVTPLATDTGVGGRGSESALGRRIAKIPKVGDVAVNATDHTVADRDRLATNVLCRIGIRDVAGGWSPLDAFRRMVGRQPQRAIVFLVVPADHRDVTLANPEGVLDYCFENTIACACLYLDAISITLKGVADCGALRVGQRFVGER